MAKSLQGEQPEVTIVCATLGKVSSLKSSIQTWATNGPNAIIIVTCPASFEAVSSDLDTLKMPCLRVLRAPEANKRIQLTIGFAACNTDYIAIADDDTTWSPTVLRSLTEPFTASTKLGAVFPEVRYRPNGSTPTLWEDLASTRLFGDCIVIRTSVLIDGGIFCASGTTALYRAAILQDEKFLDRFQNVFYRGSRVNAGDDQALTSWLCSTGWDVAVVEDRGPGGCHVSTTPRPNWKHVYQLIRWSRSDWLSYIEAVCVDRKIVWRYPFTTLCDVSWCLESFPPVLEAIALWNLTWDVSLAYMMTLILLSRFSRYIPDAVCHPRRFLILPITILYIYLIEIIKLYSLFTIFNTEWV